MTRGTQDAEFNSHKVSPSRVNAYVTCGVAFHKKYIERIPEQASGSAALFGSVLHEALEKWAGNRKELDLVTLTAQAWMTVGKGTPVTGFVAAYQSISIRAMQEEKKIRDAWAARGKESKAPRMTKDWKDSQVAKDINRLLAQWIPKLNEGSPWSFNERDSLPSLYDESLIVAKRYQDRWRHLPNALVVEFGFDVMWNDFQLHGYIDFIEPVVVEGELIAYLIGDYKTYGKEPAEQKDWRQVCMYDVAVADLRSRGLFPIDDDTPIVICADYVRLGTRKYWTMTPLDHEKLLSELTMYAAGIDGGVFLPAEKGRNPDYCPYPEDCCLRTKGDGLAIPYDLDQSLPVAA